MACLEEAGQPWVSFSADICETSRIFLRFSGLKCQVLMTDSTNMGSFCVQIFRLVGTPYPLSSVRLARCVESVVALVRCLVLCGTCMLQPREKGKCPVVVVGRCGCFPFHQGNQIVHSVVPGAVLCCVAEWPPRNCGAWRGMRILGGSQPSP